MSLLLTYTIQSKNTHDNTPRLRRGGGDVWLSIGVLIWKRRFSERRGGGDVCL